MADATKITAALEELHQRYADLDDGALADYIPELATVDPSLFSIAVATVDGDVCAVGDADTPFTIQSASKPFTYGHALGMHGRSMVLNRVGVEPTGDAFNSIIKLDAANRPHNPCVNSGAIAVTSLLREMDATASVKQLLDSFNRFAGRKLGVDLPVFTSERTHGHRNRAIAHLMLHFGMIEGDVDAILDLYFQQCAIQVTCKDLAVMAGTLANGGVNPITGERAIDAAYVRDVLTIMQTCGMYDYSGQWAYTVGLPAKSGISGGIFAVVPGRLGIACYSPRVDLHGHSVRGLRVFEDLSHEFGLHLFEVDHDGGSGTVDTMFEKRDRKAQPATVALPESPTAYTPDRGRAPEHSD
jgi:glutaminase